MNDHRPVRLLLAVFGALTIVVAVSADLVRGGGLGDIGAVQWAMVLVGAMCVVGAATWHRFPSLYRDTATILLTSVLILVGLNFAAQQLVRPAVQPDRHNPETLSYFDDEPWGREVWTSLNAILEQRVYEPYVLWGGVPYRSPLTNVSVSGERSTPGSECGDGAYRVFVFGGSTVWGYAVPDTSTIPAYLRARLAAERPDRPVCVVNLGQLAYVSTQSLVAYLARLQQGDRPDLAVFYEGYNDLFMARYTGVGAHFYMDELQRRIEGTSASLAAESLGRLGLVRLAAQARAAPSPGGPSPEFLEPSDTLARAATDHYLANVEIVDAVSERFGVPVHFFWQPIITVGDKPMTDEERRIRAFTSDAVAGFEREAAERVAAASGGMANVHFLGNVFDTVDDFVWIDAVHLTETGNRLIADAIVDAIPFDSLGATEAPRAR